MHRESQREICGEEIWENWEKRVFETVRVLIN